MIVTQSFSNSCTVQRFWCYVLLSKSCHSVHEQRRISEWILRSTLLILLFKKRKSWCGDEAWMCNNFLLHCCLVELKKSLSRLKILKDLFWFQWLHLKSSETIWLVILLFYVPTIFFLFSALYECWKYLHYRSLVLGYVVSSVLMDAHFFKCSQVSFRVDVSASNYCLGRWSTQGCD